MLSFAIVVFAFYYLFRTHMLLQKPVFIFRRNIIRSRLYLWIVCIFFISDTIITLASLRRQQTPTTSQSVLETIGISGVVLLLMIGLTTWEHMKNGEGVFQAGVAFGGQAHLWSHVSSYKMLPSKKEGHTILDLELKDPKRGNISHRRVSLPDSVVPALEAGLNQYV